MAGNLVNDGIVVPTPDFADVTWRPETTVKGSALTFSLPQTPQALLMHELEVEIVGDDSFRELAPEDVTVSGADPVKEEQSMKVDFVVNSDPQAIAEGRWSFSDLAALKTCALIGDIKTTLRGLLVRTQRIVLKVAVVATLDTAQVLMRFPMDMSWRNSVRVLRARWITVAYTGFGALAWEIYQDLRPPLPDHEESPPRQHEEEEYVLIERLPDPWH